MVSFKELKARVKQHFRFSKPELQGLILAVLITGFIFSFKDWGMGEFNLVYGLKSLLITIFAAAISFLGHVGCQKLYALSLGYNAEFKVWWIGVIAALVIAFVSLGSFPLVLAGGVTLSFMVRQRLGEFRYGPGLAEQAVTGLWGVLGSLIFAALFRVGNYFLPEVMFFEKGLMISLIFAICSVLPLPKLDGLSIFFGLRGIYYISLVVVLVSTLLLLFGGGIGLLVFITFGLIAGGIAILYGSEV
jgi:hypothetical protein